MALDSSRLRKEEIADHGDIVRHFEREEGDSHMSDAITFPESVL